MQRNLRGKRIIVMGLGINGGGVGVARFLARQGVTVLVTDRKTRGELASSIAVLRKFRNITYVLGEHRDRDFTHTDLVVAGPGIPRDSQYLALARAHGVPITSDIGLFLDRCPSQRIIAVTGSKGKTTTTALIAAMLRAGRCRVVVAGNIGVSPLDVLSNITPSTWAVLELSSWQLEGIAERMFAPQIGVITNVLPDHLDRYSGIEEYAAVKRSLVAYQHRDGIAVLNADDARVRIAARETKAAAVWFGVRRAVRRGWTIANGWIVHRDGRTTTRIMRMSAIPIPGAHNHMNVLAAAAAASAAGVAPQAIARAIRAFRGVPHRLEPVRTVRGVRYVNDSAATMPDATIAAIAAFHEPLVVIMGGKDKALDYAPLIRALARNRRVRAVVLLTHPAYNVSERIRALALRALADRIVSAGNMHEAVQLASAHARRGDVVLCSPGATSFGMFINEFDRGDQFRAEVRAL